MHGFGIVLIAVVIGLAAGCLLGAQPSINGQLGRSLEHPLQASLISFASGTAIVLVILVFIGSVSARLSDATSRTALVDLVRRRHRRRDGHDITDSRSACRFAALVRRGDDRPDACRTLP